MGAALAMKNLSQPDKQFPLIRVFGTIGWIVAGLLLVISTRTAHITGAVRWYLKPVPLINETRVALMMGLLVRFIPSLLLRSSETADAQRARVRAGIGFTCKMRPPQRTTWRSG